MIDLSTISDLAFPPQQVRSLRAEDSCVEIPVLNREVSTVGGMPDEAVVYYLNQSYIGHQMCAVLSQHWLINKACTVPAEDATRNGWSILHSEAAQLEELDARLDIKTRCKDYIRGTRMFGVRIALFLCKDAPDEYYAQPFNADSLAGGKYLGFTQIDPQWCTPEFEEGDLSSPFQLNFYEPSYWLISGRRVHRSHLCISRYAQVPDVLKPTYSFGGVSLTQMLWHRVYCAEKSADEIPKLLMSKRLSVINTDLDSMQRDVNSFMEKQKQAANNRDNYGFLNLGTDDVYSQHETTLSGVSEITSQGYSLAAAISNVPAHKLLNTSPQGLNATGEYDIAAYNEHLSSLQGHLGTTLLAAHYERQAASLGLSEPVRIEWLPLDEPSAKEQADTELVRAQQDDIYINNGVVAASEVRETLRKASTYNLEEE